MATGVNLLAQALSRSATIGTRYNNNNSNGSNNGTNSSNSGNSSSSSASSNICRFYQRGMCRFGEYCRYSHDVVGGDVIAASTAPTASKTEVAAASKAAPLQANEPSTSKNAQKNALWANAPVFVPRQQPEEPEDYCLQGAAALHVIQGGAKKSWADVVGTAGAGAGVYTYAPQQQELDGGGTQTPGCVDDLCPYDNPCPYNVYCIYALHWEACSMCDQYCLHPTDQAQRRKHNRECVQQHERDMELSFAVARSKDKTCGICFDTIMEKAGKEKRFGILPNCSHIFCLECIRKWRQAKQFEHKITRSCPECRVASDFVCPSAYWVDSKEDKDKLLTDYRKALNSKDCKYFKKGAGKCPFGNKCFYKHALPNGDLVDVGVPRRTRKVHRHPDEFLDMLDIYLWEFFDHRDYNWIQMLESSDDDSDYSDDSDDYY